MHPEILRAMSDQRGQEMRDRAHRSRLARMAIRVALHRLLAEGGLDVTVAGGALDRERFVIAALGHHCVPDDVQSFLSK